MGKGNNYLGLLGAPRKLIFPDSSLISWPSDCFAEAGGEREDQEGRGGEAGGAKQDAVILDLKQQQQQQQQQQEEVASHSVSGEVPSTIEIPSDTKLLLTKIILK